MNEVDLKAAIKEATMEVQQARKTLAFKLETLTHMLRRAGLTDDAIEDHALDESAADEHHHSRAARAVPDPSSGSAVVSPR